MIGGQNRVSEKATEKTVSLITKVSKDGYNGMSKEKV
jgi:hypothetical protein